VFKLLESKAVGHLHNVETPNQDFLGKKYPHKTCDFFSTKLMKTVETALTVSPHFSLENPQMLVFGNVFT